MAGGDLKAKVMAAMAQPFDPPYTKMHALTWALQVTARGGEGGWGSVCRGWTVGWQAQRISGAWTDQLLRLVCASLCLCDTDCLPVNNGTLPDTEWRVGFTKQEQRQQSV